MVMLMVLVAVAQNKSKNTKINKGVIQFLTVRDQVNDAMNDGFSMKTIWKHLHEIKKISCSYSMFVRYVHRYIQAPLPDNVELDDVELRDFELWNFEILRNLG